MPGKRGPKPRFTSEQLEQRMLDAALDAVISSGVTGGLDAVRMDHVISNASVPRAAAYELWRHKGSSTSQDNLRRGTLLHIVRDMPGGNAARTRDYAYEVLGELSPQIEEGTRESLLFVRREMVRRVAAFNFEDLQSQRWRIYRTITSSIGTQDDEELQQAVIQGEENLLSRYREFLEGLRQLLKLDLRPGYTVDDFVLSVYALNDGLANRMGPSFTNQVRIIDGKEWTLFAIGFDALLDRFLVYSAEA